MYSKILVPVDGSDTALKGAQRGDQDRKDFRQQDFSRSHRQRIHF
jgi:hypothetical protein